jgi:hypothetical protein
VSLRILWLGEKRGYLPDWITQLWVRATGRTVRITDYPWLEAPIGDSRGIGAGVFRRYAAKEGLTIRSTGSVRGLLESTEKLDGPGFRSEDVSADIRRFYERTSEYELEAWSEWCGAFRPFGWLMAVLFSRRLQQFNVPLRPLDTSRGTTSEIILIEDPESAQPKMAAWIRHIRESKLVLYAGAYSVTRVPGLNRPCIRVCFPLPNGNALVFLRPDVRPDGTLTVTSWGEAFGDPGFYFTLRLGAGRLAVRNVRTMREQITVFSGEDGDVRADHQMWLWGQTFLRLHYRLRPSTDLAEAAT